MQIGRGEFFDERITALIKIGDSLKCDLDAFDSVPNKLFLGFSDYLYPSEMQRFRKTYKEQSIRIIKNNNRIMRTGMYWCDIIYSFQ